MKQIALMTIVLCGLAFSLLAGEPPRLDVAVMETCLDRVGLGALTNRISVFVATDGRLARTTNRDAYAIWTENGRINIAGRTEEAAYFGVFAFLEDFVGYRFFHAGAGGTFVPAKGTVRMPSDIDVVREPAVAYRHINHWYGSLEPDIKTADYRQWLRRRGFRHESHGGGQQVIAEAVSKELFAAHPEYFPLVDGRRSAEVAEKFGKRCFSNPEVRRRVADAMFAQLEKNDSFLMDFKAETGGFCTCAACQAYGRGDDGESTTLNVCHRFWSDVVKDVLSRGRDFRGIRLLLYRDYRWPPTASDIVYDSRVCALYCPIPRCYAHPLASPCNATFRDDLAKWRLHGIQTGIFSWVCVSPVRYAPLERTFAADIAFLAKDGFGGWLDNNTSGVGSLSYSLANWATYYVISKCLWDPSVDVEKLLDETYALYYGRASAPMKAYHALRQKLWDEAPGHACAGPYVRTTYAVRDPADGDRLLAYLDEAERLAGDDADLKARLAIDRRGLEAIWLKPAKELRERLAKRRAFPAVSRVVADGSGFPADGQWAQAPELQMVSGLGLTNALAEATSVKVLAGDDVWYVRFDGELRGEPVANATKRDGHIWFDDAYEVSLSPPSGGYYHVIVNTKGAVYDSEGAAGTHFDAGVETRMTRPDGRWVVDLKVPAKRMHAAGLVPGETWGFVFCRDNPRTGDGGAVDGANAHDVTCARVVTVP